MKRLIIILTLGLFTTVHGQTTFPKLEKILTKELSENPSEDGNWVFYPDNAAIEKIDKPSVRAVIPNYTFYKVNLTNYLGYHVNEGTCLILYDSAKSRIILVEPLWYSGTSEQLLKFFINKPFDTQDTLLTFLEELNDLMEIGSGYKFVNTSSSDTLITYDLVYFKGDSYTTSSGWTSSTVNYNQDGIWRQIKIDINKLRIVKYTVINPATKDEVIVK